MKRPVFLLPTTGKSREQMKAEARAAVWFALGDDRDDTGDEDRDGD